MMSAFPKSNRIRGRVCDFAIRIAGVPRQYGSDVNNPALEMRDKQSFTERERQ